MLAKVIPLARTVVSGSWAATKLAGGMLSMSRDIKIGVTATGLFIAAVSTAWVYRSHFEESWSTPASTPASASAPSPTPAPSTPPPVPPAAPVVVATAAAAAVPAAAAGPPPLAPPGLPALPAFPADEPEEIEQPKPPAVVPQPNPAATVNSTSPPKPAPASDGFLAPPPMLPSSRPSATASNNEPLAPPPKPTIPARAVDTPKPVAREPVGANLPTDRMEDDLPTQATPIAKPSARTAAANAPASVKPTSRGDSEGNLSTPPPAAPAKPSTTSWTPVAATQTPTKPKVDVDDAEEEVPSPSRPLVMPAPTERRTELVRSSVTDAVTNRSIPQSASLVPAANSGDEKKANGRPAGAKVIAESVAVARGTPVLGLPVTTRPTTDGPTPIASTRPPAEPVEQTLNDEDVRERTAVPNTVEEYVPIGRSQSAAAVIREDYVAVGANAVIGPQRQDDIRLTSAEQPIDDNKALVKSYDAETYVVLNGDTFDSIARTMYHNRELGAALARYNRSRGASNIPLRAGARVVVPPVKVLEGAPTEREPAIVAAERTPLTAAAFPVKREVERADTVLRPATVASTANEPVGPTPIPSRTPVATGRPQQPGEGAVATTRVIAGQPISSSSGGEQPLKIPAAQTPRGAGPSYTVTQRETLYAISRRVLGDGRRWREIYDLNTDRLESEYEVPVGVTLRLPAENRR